MKLVVFDIDGTLVDKKTHQLAISTKKAIEKCKQANIKVLLATGRTYFSIEKEIIDQVKPDGFVTLNGQVCLDGYGKIISDMPLDVSIVEEFIEYAHKNQWEFGFHLESKTVMYQGEFLQKSITEMLGHDGGIVKSDSLKEHLDEHAYTMIVKAKDESVLDLFLQNNPNLRKDSFLPQCYDVFNAMADKAVGIEVFLKKWNLSFDDVVAFGDNTNDVGMLRKARHAYVVAGGPESMKQLGLPIIKGPLHHDLSDILIKHIPGSSFASLSSEDVLIRMNGNRLKITSLISFFLLLAGINEWLIKQNSSNGMVYLILGVIMGVLSLNVYVKGKK